MSIRALLAIKAKKKVKKELKVQEKLNLEMRDKLAMERTKMANERTFMAYMRTALAMVLAGLTFIKVFDDDPFYVGVGLAFIPVGIGFAVFGYYRFSKKKREVAQHTYAYAPTSPVHAKVAAQDEEEAQNLSP